MDVHVYDISMCVEWFWSISKSGDLGCWWYSTCSSSVPFQEPLWGLNKCKANHLKPSLRPIRGCNQRVPKICIIMFHYFILVRQVTNHDHRSSLSWFPFGIPTRPVISGKLGRNQRFIRSKRDAKCELLHGFPAIQTKIPHITPAHIDRNLHRLSTSKMKPFGSASSFDVLKKAHRNMHVNTHVQYILYHLSI